MKNMKRFFLAFTLAMIATLSVGTAFAQTGMPMPQQCTDFKECTGSCFDQCWNAPFQKSPMCPKCHPKTRRTGGSISFELLLLSAYSMATSVF